MSDFSNTAPSPLSLQPTSQLETNSPIGKTNNRPVFAPRGWTSRAFSALQATALLVSGVFLLTNITDTPGLEFQVALLGTLLIAGGFGMLSQLSRWET